jgi:NAD(P)-dependent dehydrogenase (short-subunit alcohol dehydrogenase family)
VTFLDLDVASDESVTTVVQRVIERFGRIDVLINNAGVGTAGAAEESSVAQAQAPLRGQRLRPHRMTKAVDLLTVLRNLRRSNSRSGS